ncbi:uncharacterized protein LOC107636775 [Arachis ipaensis]|uniref:uncharacterized protein LOC107636775 n=1 Tax=Arachis ipaensis TaxID=130454 RepID=UPI0007AFD4A2|nr:uncharacterized protein LOC107636775 [Arachis ipaensis]
MATRRRGRTRSRRESRNDQLADNHVKFIEAMANLANTMEANAAATLQAVQRLGQPAGNENGEGNGNDNAEGNDDNMGGAPITLATFLKVHPPSFRGSTNPIEADNWFQAMEHALQTQHVPNNQYVEFAAYQLLGEAQHWWQGECHLLQLQNADVPWDVFQMAFYKKYLPESAREATEIELLQLKQRSSSVANYTSQFEELCRFSRVCQGAPETYESWKRIRYQRGLKDNIMTAMAPLEIRIFSDLVNKARVVEEYAQTVASSRDTRGGNTSRERDDYLGPSGQHFKKNGEGKQSRAYSPDMKCQECGNYHPNKSYRLGFEKYYKIGIWFKGKNFRILNDDNQSDAVEGEREY